MSTPTSTTLPPPSKPTPRSTTATGLTPASASSPSGPRSVPSPAYLYAANTKAGKSPYKQSTTVSTPTALQGIQGSSPADGRGRGKSVTGSEGTPAINLNGLGPGTGNGIANGNGGALVNAGGGLSLLDGTNIVGLQQDMGGGLGLRDNEQERQRRIVGIVEVLGRKWGRVGQKGVERCARRLGMECLWEDDGAGLSFSRERTRTLSIAGNGLLVDVEFLGEEVTSVVLSFPGSGEGAGRSTAEGAEILRRNLVGRRKGYVPLDAFAENLERLARLDQLGREGVSCFDAVEGVHESLKRIYEWELEKIRQDGMIGLNGERIAREAQCKKSGRPRMHVDGKIGLQLQYWRDRWLVPPRKRKADEMELDLPNPETNNHSSSPYRPQSYALTISCEASSASLYPSIKISSAWVSSTVAQQSLELDDLFAAPESIIEWLQPPATYTIPPSPTNTASLSLDDPTALLTGHLPNIRFVAHFDPPLIVPLRTAIELYDAVGSPIAQTDYQSTTYASLLLPHLFSKPSSSFSSDTLQASVSLSKTVHVFHPPSQLSDVQRNGNINDQPTSHQSHDYNLTLFTPKDDWARSVSKIPFEHPRQLVSFLPTLRQWALAGSILRRTFTSVPSPTTKPQPNPPSTLTRTSSTSSTSSSSSYSSTTSTPHSPPKTPPRTPLDIAFSIHPFPHLTVTSPSVSAAVNIATNGEVELVDFYPSFRRDGKTDEEEEEEEEGQTATRMGRGLAVLEDLAAWVAWMGSKERERERERE